MEEKQLVEELEFVSVKATADSSLEADKRRCSRETQSPNMETCSERATAEGPKVQGGRKTRETKENFL